MLLNENTKTRIAWQYKPPGIAIQIAPCNCATTSKCNEDHFKGQITIGDLSNAICIYVTAVIRAIINLKEFVLRNERGTLIISALLDYFLVIIRTPNNVTNKTSLHPKKKLTFLKLFFDMIRSLHAFDSTSVFIRSLQFLKNSSIIYIVYSRKL